MAKKWTKEQIKKCVQQDCANLDYIERCLYRHKPYFMDYDIGKELVAMLMTLGYVRTGLRCLGRQANPDVKYDFTSEAQAAGEGEAGEFVTEGKMDNYYGNLPIGAIPADYQYLQDTLEKTVILLDAMRMADKYYLTLDFDVLKWEKELRGKYPELIPSK